MFCSLHSSLKLFIEMIDDIDEVSPFCDTYYELHARNGNREALVTLRLQLLLDVLLMVLLCSLEQ